MADILFIKTSSLGDVIHHMPALTEARARRPDARFAWLVEEAFAPLVRLHPAIDTVVTRTKGDTTLVGVLYGNHARGVLPIRARFTFSDGSTQDYRYPANVWSQNSSQYGRRYDFVGKTLVKIEIDPDKRLIDVNRANNAWTAKPAAVNP